MYLAYWKLDRKPFANTPDPLFLYNSVQHEEALTRMLYTILEDRGGMLLSGECGIGKTLLSRAMIGQLSPERYEAALIHNPSLSAPDLLRELLQQFGHPLPAATPKADLLHALQRCLQTHCRANRHTVVIVDEAQVVEDNHVLEELRMLLNYQSNSRFLLTLILMGQPEIGRRIDAMPQLKQRFAVRYDIARFSQRQTVEYMRHRLAIAGARHEIFTPGAESLIAASCGGLPRQINNICDMALLMASGRKMPAVDDAMIQEVLRDMGGVRGLDG